MDAKYKGFTVVDFLVMIIINFSVVDFLVMIIMNFLHSDMPHWFRAWGQWASVLKNAISYKCPYTLAIVAHY